MLTQVQAEKLAQEQQTTTDNIIKEHYQIYILDNLFGAKIQDKLVFKGGTALRLAYKSFRYSEDLDFSLAGEVSFTEFKQLIQNFVKLFPEAKIQDIHDKWQTLYAKIVFATDFKPIPFGVKVEINKVSDTFTPQIQLLSSPNNNLAVTGRVYSLESILADKVKILHQNSRRQPRDLFDAWYISQQLGQKFVVEEKYKYQSKELMNGLNPLLPKKYRNVLELFSI